MKLNFLPTVIKDDSELSAGSFIDSNGIRFVEDKWQSRGGREKINATAITGIARGAHAWADTGRNPFAAFGTHLRLWALDVDGNEYDITPIISRGELTNPFSTTISLTSVNVADTAHGLVADQKVFFANASAVGGLTIAGEYTVTTVVDADNYTITAASAASSTAGPGGGTVDYFYYLEPGQVDGLGGLGFGVGGYGSGTYGSPSSGYTLFPRTWALDNWGQNLVANPRGGAIFEWAPNVTASELITDGNFSSSTYWSVSGAGVSVSGSNANFSVSNGTLQQTVTLFSDAWHIIDFDLSVSAGSLAPVAGGLTIGSAVTAAGTYKRVFYSYAGGSTAIKFIGAACTANLDNVSVKVLATATQIDHAPTQVTSIFVTPERSLVALGCDDDNGNFAPLQIRWSDRENNQVWTASASNLAGDDILSQGTRIVRGIVGRGENLIFTDTAVYSMRSVADINVVYRFDLIGTGCGLIGPNAVAALGGVIYWMSPDGNFYAYDGTTPKVLPCGVKRYVKDNLASVQGDKIFAAPIAQFGEIQWLYPDENDGNECSRYVKVNAKGQWDIGILARTSWLDAGVFPFPLSVDTSGYIRYEEKGFDDEGAALSGYIESAYVDLEKGSTVIINGLYPDNDDLQGGYTLTPTIRNRDVRGNFSRSTGPFSITSTTGRVSIRAKGRQVKLRWDWDDAPVFVRQGADDWDVKKVQGRS